MRLYGEIQSGLASGGGRGMGNAAWFQVLQAEEAMQRTGNGDDADNDGAMTGLGRMRGAAAVTLAEAMDFSDVRMERVARLRAAIANGSYMVSAAALADRMSAKLFGAGLGAAGLGAGFGETGTGGRG